MAIRTEEQLPEWVRERRRTEWARTARRDHPDAGLIEIGSWVTHGSPPLDDEDRMALEERVMDGDAKAGVVWRIATDVDPDTGAISRAFMVVRQWKGTVVFARWTPDQIAQVGLPNVASVRSMARAIARHLGDRKRRGAFTSDDLQALDALNALVGSLS